MPTIEQTATATETATATSREPDIMSLAAQADSGSLPETATQTPETSEKKDGQPAEQGATNQPKDAPAKPTDETNAPQESKYAKTKKEAERKDRSWKKLEEEKAEVRRKQAELDERLKQFNQPKPAEPAKKTGPKAEDYEALAEQYEDEGKTSLARAARQKAEEIRQAEKNEATETAPQANGNPFSQPQFKEAWQRNVQDLVASDPDLAKPENPVVMTANNLCRDPQYAKFFTAHPDGIRAAVEVARLIRDAQQAKALQDQNAELQEKYTKAQAEVDRLTKATSLGGSTPASKGSAPKAITDMSTSDAEKTLRDLAAAADRGEIP